MVKSEPRSKTGAKKSWKRMIATEGPKIVSTFEDPGGRRFSFLYSGGWVALYDHSGDLIYSQELDHALGVFDLARKMVVISPESIAYQWLAGCLRGARGFEK